MKELFTKNFWKDVKTTYEEAQKEAPVVEVKPVEEKKEADCQSANALPTPAPAGCQPAPPGTTE